MLDFEAARLQMIDTQLRTSDVTDHRVLKAFLETPRESFVSRANASLAYMDDDVLIGFGSGSGPRYLLEPRILGRMIQDLAIGPDDSVLVVGTGSGYSAAVLSQLADSVIAVECDADLVEAASDTLDRLEISNVAVVEGALAEGYADQAPYDAILIDGAVERLPDALPAQLANGGRLAAVIGAPPYGSVHLMTRSGDTISKRRILDSAARLLPGFDVDREFVF